MIARAPTSHSPAETGRSPTGKVKERIADPETCRKIAAEMTENLASLGQPDYSFATVARFRPNPAYEGKTISEINLMKGRTATVANEIETIFRHHERRRRADDLTTRWAHRRRTHHALSLHCHRQPMAGIVEFGAGMPHPRNYERTRACSGEYVRNRGVLTWEDAIRRNDFPCPPAPSPSAIVAWLRKDGRRSRRLRPSPRRNKATFAKPHQYSQGFDFVAGQPVK